MKNFATKFIYNGQEYTGPDIHTDTEENARIIAEGQGYVVTGELTDIFDLDFDHRPRVIH